MGGVKSGGGGGRLRLAGPCKYVGISSCTFQGRTGNKGANANCISLGRGNF